MKCPYCKNKLIVFHTFQMSENEPIKKSYTCNKCELELDYSPKDKFISLINFHTEVDDIPIILNIDYLENTTEIFRNVGLTDDDFVVKLDHAIEFNSETILNKLKTILVFQ